MSARALKKIRDWWRALVLALVGHCFAWQSKASFFLSIGSCATRLRAHHHCCLPLVLLLLLHPRSHLKPAKGLSQHTLATPVLVCMRGPTTTLVMVWGHTHTPKRRPTSQFCNWQMLHFFSLRLTNHPTVYWLQ